MAQRKSVLRSEARRPSQSSPSVEEKTPTKISDATVLKRNPTLLVREREDKTIAILDLQNEQSFFQLDGVAAEFWLLINGTKTLGEIKARLIKKHSPPLNVFEKKVSDLIHDLKKQNLLT